MSSIGKITSSLLSIPAELTVAAASINLDFSLFKVEAPKEFHGVRDALSQVRRENAESGLPHITARKLGALFEPLVPPIPNLVSAYGQRVSEISSKISSESSSNSRAGFGIFSSQAGPDATNIWAAATSGRGAMAVQLLACMLARIWNEAEAISLWVELVERRRIEVNDSTVDGSSVAALMAAKQTFNREQLAAWDSSARSWIKTADAHMRVQQTQLMLIISNIELPVNSSRDLYDSVIKAWTSAMMAVEKLVQGIPQQIRDGSILLAISSWHLYPDMAVLSEVMTRVEQNDPLMHSSLVTFSVHISPASEDSAGVFWSLPMAHMRYYSPPILAQRRLTSDTSRVSMEEFLIVVLGMVVSPWLRSFCPDTSRCCRLVCLLWNWVKRLPHRKEEPDLAWLSILSGAADRYLSATGVLSQQYSKLLSLGIRSRNRFLGERPQQDSVFGLTNFGNILSLVQDELMEDKINYLRQIAQSRSLDSEELIIRCAGGNLQDNKKDAHTAKFSNRDNFPDRIPTSFWAKFEIGRTSNETYRGSVYDYTSVAHGQQSTENWFAYSPAHGRNHGPWFIERMRKSNKPSGDRLSGPPSIYGASATVHASRTGPGYDVPENYEHSSNTYETGTICGLDRGAWLSWCKEDDSSLTQSVSKCAAPQNGDAPTVYTFVLGDVNSCGIYRRSTYRRSDQINLKPTSPKAEHEATIDEVEAILRSSIITPDLVRDALQRWFQQSPIQEFLTAMVFAKTLYQGLPGATVSLEVLKPPLSSAGWSHADLKVAKDKTHLPTLFSCLAMFESGQFVVSPSALEGVMAMSSYDSIFVASALISDPSENKLQHPIKRVFGNMGRSETVFLIPPADPRFKESDPGSWHLIDHLKFDGQFLDSFKSTSLHLKLTEFELPIDVGTRGLRDTQAVLLESVITVNDKGLELGDLNILSALDSDLVVRAEPCTHGSNSEEHECAVDCSSVTKEAVMQSSQDSREDSANIVSLDCWDELLDPPETSCGIFRATGNWQARLAAMAVCKQKGYRVRVLPKRPCALCIESGGGFDDFAVLIA